jgi:pimeloyl-ACP methyl ester carboxylesterase
MRALTPDLTAPAVTAAAAPRLARRCAQRRRRRAAGLLFGLMLLAGAATAVRAQDAGDDLNFYPRIDDAADPIAGRTPLILIHGFWSDPSVWDQFLCLYDRDPALQQQFKIYLVNYGRVAPITYDGNQILNLAQDLGEWLQASYGMTGADSWGGRKVVILAHSLGGVIARTFMEQFSILDNQKAVRGGDVVARLITMATPHHGTPLADDAEVASGVLSFFVTPGLAWDDYDDAAFLSFLPNPFLRCVNDFQPVIDSGFSAQGCPAGVPSYLTGYYGSIIAYGGTATSAQVQSDPNAPSELIQGLADYLGMLSGYTSNDGVVPIQSTLFDDWPIMARWRSDDACDHYALPRLGRLSTGDCSTVTACLINGNDPFQQLRLDLLAAAPPPQTLQAALTATPASAVAPSQTTLTATASGTAAGAINYTFWWNCADTGTNVANEMLVCGTVPTPIATNTCASNANGIKCNGVTADPEIAGNLYASPGTYTAKVIVERGNTSAQAQATVTVTSPACPTPAAPSPLSPASGATGLSPSPLIAWSAVAGISVYQVDVCSDSLCATVLRQLTVDNDTQTQLSPALSAPGTYRWQVRAVGNCGPGAWSAISSFSVAAPAGGGDFGLACSPASLIAPRGGGAGTTCTVTSLAGFTGSVALTAQGLPSGISAASTNWSLQPPSGGSAATAVGINVQPGTAPGTYPFTFAGTSGTLTHSFPATVTVPAAADFSLACTPATMSALQGATVATSCTLTSLNGFAGTVTLAVAAAPTTVGVTLSTPALTVAAGGSASAMLTFAIGSATAPESYGIIVTGASGSLSHAAVLTLGVTGGPDFALTCTATALATTPGAAATTTCTVTPLNGFSGTVALSCQPTTPQVACAFNPPQLTVTAAASAATVLTALANPLAPAGDVFAILVGGTSNGVERTTSVELLVNAAPDFALACDPLATGAAPGGLAQLTCTVNSLNTFSSPVALSCQGLPAGVTCGFAQTPLTPAAGGSSATVLTLGVGAGVTPAAYPFTVAGAGGSLTHGAAATLTVLGSGALWARSYAGNEQLNAVAATADGGSVAAGIEIPTSGNASYLTRLDAQGNVLWKNLYNSPTNLLRIFDVVTTAAGGFVVAGEELTENPACNEEDLWVAMLDSAGSVLWQRSYGLCGLSSNAWGVIATADGGVLAVGDSPEVGAGNADGWLVKLDGAGNVQWQRAYGGSGPDRLLSVRQTADGGFIAVGYTASFGVANIDGWALKLDSGGNVQWQNAYGGAGNDILYGVVPLSDGGYLTAGTTSGSFGGGGRWVMRLDALGNPLWQEVLSNANHLGIDADREKYGFAHGDGDAIVIGGASYLLDNGAQTWVTEVDATGAVLWQNLFQAGEGYGVDRTPTGGILVGVQTSEIGSLGTQQLSLNPQGAILSCSAMTGTAAVVTPITATLTATPGQVTPTPVVPVATGVTVSAATAPAVTEQCNSADQRLALVCTPTALSAPAGGGANAACQLSSLGGVSGTVSLSCQGLPPGFTCAFGTNPVTLAANGSLGIPFSVAVAGGAAAGGHAFRVVATTAGGISATAAATIALLAPAVSSAAPVFGPSGGGTAVTLLGANFTAASTVAFGGAAATAVTFVSPSTLTAVTPAHAPGAVDITVTNPGGESGTLPGGFTYECATPPTALVSGSVTICAGQQATIQASLSGTAPFSFQWSDGVLASGVTATLVTRTVRPTTTTSYTVTTLQDGTCPGSTSGTATVTVDTGRTCGGFYTLPPCRLVDTRNVAGPFGGPAIAAGEERVFVLAGRCGIPATAKAVSLNVTAVTPSTAGSLSLHPSGLTVQTSTIDYQTGAVLANNAVIQLAVGASLSITSTQTTGTTHLVLDVNGYFQ